MLIRPLRYRFLFRFHPSRRTFIVGQVSSSSVMDPRCNLQPSFSAGMAVGLFIMFFLLAGCSSTPHLVSTPALPDAIDVPAERDESSEPDLKASLAEEAVESDARGVSMIEERLRAAERRWHGTPYRWGGTSTEGVDCSGYVKVTYRDEFDLDLPRTTADQVQAGRPVSRDSLQAGDLVFFLTYGKKTRHVGIYLGEGEFAHASTSYGVTISRLTNPYWNQAYWKARRLLPTEQFTAAPQRLHPVSLQLRDPPTPLPLRSTASPKTPPGRRTGW